MPRGTLEIGEFVPRRSVLAAASFPSLPSDKPARFDLLSNLRLQYRAGTSVFTAVAVLALHALILAPVLRGGSSTDHHSERFGAPNAIHAMLIDDRSSAAIAPPALSAPVFRSVTVNFTPPHRDKPGPGLAALSGQYLGQIHARIDRAWLRPRTAIGAEVFRCQVEIRQRRDGKVETITLQDCNGTVGWQESLVRGIEAASPLPAPPNPAVFAKRVVLHFRAVAYAPGQPADTYESMRPALNVDDQVPSALAQLRLLRRPAKSRVGRRVIELRIDGSHVEVGPQREGTARAELP